MSYLVPGSFVTTGFGMQNRHGTLVVLDVDGQKERSNICEEHTQKLLYILVPHKLLRLPGGSLVLLLFVVLRFACFVLWFSRSLFPRVYYFEGP